MAISNSHFTSCYSNFTTIIKYLLNALLVENNFLNTDINDIHNNEYNNYSVIL